MKLKGRVALITGGGRGIGRAIALAFAQEGTDIFIAGLDQPRLNAAAEAVRALGRRCLARVADVSDEAQVVQVVEEALKEFGKIDILVNNAGIAGPTAPVVKVTRKEWDETLAVNLTGPFLCAKAVLPQMIARRRGKIINIASVAAELAYPLRSPYATSKWGLLGLSRTIAAEVGEHNIQVNAICPGPVAGDRMSSVIERRATELGKSFDEVERDYSQATALKRMVEEKDIAAMALFLASDDGNSITGAVFDVTAGYAL
jgi:NAD(P)-dependent dehydrogenase (short-subunit alcohol dehydrogenase family)